MLEYGSHFPDHAKDGDPVIVLLHGRGSDKNDLLGLAPLFPANALVMTPQAPFPGAPWGYGGGWAWYQFLGGTTPESSSFIAGQNALAEFVDALPRILPVKPGPLIFGGFSQGSSTGLAFALRNPGKTTGVFVFSGLLLNHPSVAEGLETAAGLPVFWGHGTRDTMISHETGEAGRAALRAAGAIVTPGDYPIGHAIDQDELKDMRSWLDDLLTK